MQPHDLLEVQFGNMSGNIGLVTRDKVSHFREAIHHNKKRVHVLLGPYGYPSIVHPYIKEDQFLKSKKEPWIEVATG